jgi:hypothetical protein
MRFTLDGGARLDTEAEYNKNKKATNYVFVSLTLQSTQIAMFESAVVLVKTDSSEMPISLAIPEMRVGYTEESKDHRLTRTTGTQIHANEKMEGRRPDSSGGTRETTFSFRLDLPFQEPSKFIMTLPAITIGDHRILIDAVRFNYGEHPRLLGLACS